MIWRGDGFGTDNGVNADVRQGIKAGVLALSLLSGLLLWWGNEALRALESDAPSQSIGSPSKGRLEHGKRLPTRGTNFTTYSNLGALLGRQAVHGKVRDLVLDVYGVLAKEHPETTYLLGETGWPDGGPFSPHRTHQNGLSVDFMVPLRNAAGEPVVMGCWPWNKFGYGLEYDAEGRRGEERIDFDALGAHLYHLGKRAKKHGLKIEQVILAPNLRDELFASKHGPWIKKHLAFLKRGAWVRHDDHYHVDFALE